MRKPTPEFWIQKNRQWKEKMQQQTKAERLALEQGQAPKALWIGCVDSRVNPSQILSMDPGELLVHRNMGNISTDPAVQGTLEFGISQLGIRTIVLCGHYGCGAVQAAMTLPETTTQDSPAETWIRQHIHVDPQHSWESACETHTYQQLQDLINLPIFDRLEKTYGPLDVYVFMYHIGTGELEPLKARSKHVNTSKSDASFNASLSDNDQGMISQLAN